MLWNWCSTESSTAERTIVALASDNSAFGSQLSPRAARLRVPPIFPELSRRRVQTRAENRAEFAEFRVVLKNVLDTFRAQLTHGIGALCWTPHSGFIPTTLGMYVAGDEPRLCLDLPSGRRDVDVSMIREVCSQEMLRNVHGLDMAIPTDALTLVLVLEEGAPMVLRLAEPLATEYLAFALLAFRGGLRHRVGREADLMDAVVRYAVAEYAGTEV